MRVDGVTLVAARADGCTIAKSRDGRLSIGTWQTRFAVANDLVWWRQTPACLVEDGAFGPGVLAEQNLNWGSSVSGSTFIRRSAVGIDESKQILFVGVGERISASALATGLKHAGAQTVAQLDVNGMLPKFVLYRPTKPGSTEPVASPLYEGLQCYEDEYVGRPAPRDFFYVTRRPKPVAARERRVPVSATSPGG